jgi:hypothetical protein
MTIKRALLIASLWLAGCEAVAPAPSPFRPEDKVVPVALEPDRPRPPPPSRVEVQRVPRAPTR